MRSDNQGSTALVVEDDGASAYLLEFMLNRQGFTVIRAADGRETVKFVEQQPAVDIVILDIMLPYLDGFEIIALMRAHPQWRNVPIIVLSGRSKEEDVVRALEAGANDYIRKPYQPAELMARINCRLAAAREQDAA